MTDRYGLVLGLPFSTGVLLQKQLKYRFSHAIGNNLKLVCFTEFIICLKIISELSNYDIDNLISCSLCLLLECSLSLCVFLSLESSSQIWHVPLSLVELISRRDWELLKSLPKSVTSVKWLFLFLL